MTRTDNVVETVIAYYLNSGDFNGLPIDSEHALLAERELLESRIKAGDLQVVNSDDFPNPSIRPWKSMRDAESQIEDIRSVAAGGDRVCLYPTPQALADRLDDNLYRDEPYCRRLAEGAGQLDLAFFALDALEPYRNDPRYRFVFWDFGLTIGIGDDAFQDESEPERDKVASIDVGFAYDFGSVDGDGPLLRRACVHYRDLSKLTAEHQRRWETYSVEEQEPLKPHPSWWGAQMGHWPDGIGPFEKVIGEMVAINDLFERAFGERLFRSTDRPRELGWVLRPSKAEWDQFVLTFDKLLGDNLRHKALDVGGAATNADSGERLGTIARLERFLVDRGRLPSDYVEDLIRSWRDVRAARQDPAHKLSANLTDKTLVRRQAELVSDVGQSLHAIRHALTSHPENGDWSVPGHLDGRVYRL